MCGSVNWCLDLKCLFWVVQYIHVFLSVSVQGPYQRTLLKNLLKDYNPMERPIANDSQPLTVFLSMSLIQIMDVVSHTFSSHFFLSSSWVLWSIAIWYESQCVFDLIPLVLYKSICNVLLKCYAFCFLNLSEKTFLSGSGCFMKIFIRFSPCFPFSCHHQHIDVLCLKYVLNVARAENSLTLNIFAHTGWEKSSTDLQYLA